MTRIIIFSVEGIESNTEVNFFNGLGLRLPDINLRCYAIGKHNKKEKLIDALRQAIKKMENFICHETNKLIFLFVGDYDDKQHIPAMQNSAKWAKEFLNEYQDVLFKNIEIEINDTVHGDEGHSIEKSLSRAKLKFKADNLKKGTNHHIFNNAIAGTEWETNNELDIDRAIASLHAIESNYKNIFLYIKHAIKK